MKNFASDLTGRSRIKLFKSFSSAKNNAPCLSSFKRKPTRIMTKYKSYMLEIRLLRKEYVPKFFHSDFSRLIYLSNKADLRCFLNQILKSIIEAKN